MAEHEPQGDEFLEKALAAGSLRAKVSPWTTREKVGRALWMILRVPLFRLSWHNWYAWRRMVLRMFGARIGRRCNIRPTARIEIPWLLEMDDICPQPKAPGPEPARYCYRTLGAVDCYDAPEAETRARSVVIASPAIEAPAE